MGWKRKLLFGFGILVLFIIIYALFRGGYDLWAWIAVGVVSFSGFVWFFSNYVWQYLPFNRHDFAKLPKEYVNQVSLIQAWKESFIKNEGIPYKEISVNNEDHIVPINPKAIRVLSRSPVADKRTPNTFYKFEVDVRGGFMQGMHTIVLPMDRGVDFVKENYLWFFEHKSPLNGTKVPVTDFTSPQSHNEALDLLAIAYEREGYGSEDIADLRRLRARDSPLTNENRDEPQEIEVPDNLDLPEEEQNKEFGVDQYKKGVSGS